MADGNGSSLNRRRFLTLAIGVAGSLAASRRSFPAQSGRAGTAAIDMHAHFFPREFLDALARDGGAPGFDVDFSRREAPVLVQGQVRTPLDQTYWDLPARIRRMDAQGVGLHVLSLTTPMVHWAPAARGAALARIVNDAMMAGHAAFPDRFVGAATLPLQDVERAVAELDRLQGQRGIRAVCLPTALEGRELSDATLDPIYQRCEAMELPVLLHPVTVIGADRLQPYYLRNLLGNPFETATAAAFLMFGGVLDRFPRLNVVLPHGGGALPSLVGRLQRGQSVRPELRGAARADVAAYLRRFHFDTITHSQASLRALVDLVGSNRVVLGSDYCFDMGDDHPRDIVARLKLPSPDRERILSGNAKRLLHL
jgi:aminocarboxymuconate-semialdehyde decarboxylase